MNLIDRGQQYKAALTIRGLERHLILVFSLHSLEGWKWNGAGADGAKANLNSTSQPSVNRGSISRAPTPISRGSRLSELTECNNA